MKPQVDPKGRSQLDESRTPTQEEEYIPKVGMRLYEPVRYGNWDPDAEDDLQKAAATAAPSAAPPAAPVAAAPTSKPAVSKTTARRLKLTQRALAMRVAGHSVNDIANVLSVTPSTVVSWFTQHAREVSLDEIDDKLDRIAVPLATENLIHGLLAGDKDYTLETLKGRGRFRKHVEGDGKPNTDLPELRISFEMPEARPIDAAVPIGVIIGQPQMPEILTTAVEVPSAPLDAPLPAVLPSAHAAPPASEPVAPLVVGRPVGADAD